MHFFRLSLQIFSKPDTKQHSMHEYCVRKRNGLITYIIYIIHIYIIYI